MNTSTGLAFILANDKGFRMIAGNKGSMPGPKQISLGLVMCLHSGA